MKRLLLFILVLPALLSASSRSLTAEDIYLLKNISDIKLSLDGLYLAYIITGMDRDSNSYESEIWLYDTQNQHRKKVSDAEICHYSALTWSPDSRQLAYFSTRNQNAQIWRQSIPDGVPMQVTEMPLGAMSPSWSPDGNKLTFMSLTEEAPKIQSLVSQGDRLINPMGREYAADVMVIDRLRYREGTDYLGEYYMQIFTIHSDGTQLQQLTAGNVDNFYPFWSPNNRHIAFMSNRSGHQDLDDNIDVCLVPVAGGDVTVLSQNPGTDQLPIWSPSGQKVAWVANRQLNQYTGQLEIFLAEPSTGKQNVLSELFDRTLSAVQWGVDDSDLFCLAADSGAQHLYHVSPKNSEFKRIIAGRREIQTYAPAVKQNKIYFTASDPKHPSDLFVCDLNGANEEQLTFLNDSLLQCRDLVQPQEVFYTSPDGTPIHGWVMAPLAGRPGKKQPLVVQIHGGPYWHYGWRWEYDFQQLIGRGFGVFFCNPRISTSYGQAFAEKDQGKWAEGDLQDVLAGIDYVTQNFPWADSSRIGVTGGSYGGYLTNMLLAKTDRFKAGVAQRSITNLLSYYATTDVQNFIEFEFGWPLSKEELLQRSPVWLADQIKTPLLLIHSENDYRVPISQAEELYVHLKRRGQIVQLLRFPNEGHELSRSGQPLHRVDRMNRIADWFEIYLK